MDGMSKCEFTPPKGFTAPQTDDPNGEFDLVATFKPCGNGKLCMTKLGDMDMPMGDSEHKQSYESEARAIAESMPQSMGQQTEY